MLNVKSTAIALQILVIISSINFIFESIDSGVDLLDSTLELSENYIEPSWSPMNNDGSCPCQDSGSRSKGAYPGRTLIEDMNHGGSWLDSFEDDSGIYWSQSDQVNISLGDARIHIPYYADPFTVAFWHFDEGVSNQVYDMTENHNDGSIIGAAWTSGKFGKCLSFDGINDGIDIPDSPSISIKGSVSVSAWINFTNVNSPKVPILKKREAGADSYKMEIRDTSKVYFHVDTGSGSYVQSTTVLNDGKWHFVTGTWDKSVLKLYVDGKLDAAPVVKTGNMVDTADKMTIGYGRRFQGGVGYWEYYDGLVDEIRVSNIARSAVEIRDAYENGTPTNVRYANLTSEIISLPPNMRWDSLIVNITQPANTYLNITVLNAANNQPIQGVPMYSTSNEFDISYLDPIIYPSIKLHAAFQGNKDHTPILHYWGVSWNTSNTWEDTLFGGAKLENLDPVNIDVFDGKAIFKAPSSMISTSISVPQDSYYDTLEINKYESEDTILLVNVLDAKTNQIIRGFDNLTNEIIELSSIDIREYTAIKLNATSDATGPGTAVLYDWSLNWTEIKPPIITNLQSLPTVNRTQTAIIEINITYRPEIIDTLTFLVEHMAPQGSAWQAEYISNIHFENDRWLCSFTPALDSKLGLYSIRATCNDSLKHFDIYVETDLIKVINNKPTPPEVTFLNPKPQTRYDLTVIAKNAHDLETPINDIKYMYRWYQNSDYQSKFDNQTTITHTVTAKGDLWRCEAYPFDGDDLGNPGEAQVVIQNTPPELIVSFERVQIFEDSPVILDRKLDNIFFDVDDDILVYSATGQSNIVVKITQENGTLELIPTKNWFGDEYITFYANDSSAINAIATVLVTVLPTNDLPLITYIGDQSAFSTHSELEFIIKQNEWLNLTIQIEDLDGDLARGTVSCILNITERQNLYIQDENKRFVFHPTNQDVGVHYINIKVTDNNETPLKYITQKIKIEVININDPPTVKILMPVDDKGFLETDLISFVCVPYDVDLFLKDNNEELTIQWYSEKSGPLGITEQLTNISLIPGQHNISVTVKDAGGESESDYVHIIVKEVEKDKDKPKSSQFLTTINFLIWPLILIIILIISGLVIINYQLKKMKLAASVTPGGQVLQPDDAYQGSKGTAVGTLGEKHTPAAMALDSAPAGILPVTAQLASSSALVSPTGTTSPVEQLPPARTLDTQAGASISSLGLRLDLKQKLELLDVRFRNGELSQETYLNLKDKYEHDLAKYQPLPQLPPASKSATTPTSIPTSEVPSASAVPVTPITATDTGAEPSETPTTAQPIITTQPQTPPTPQLSSETSTSASPTLSLEQNTTKNEPENKLDSRGD